MDQQNPTNTDWGTGSTGSKGSTTGTGSGFGSGGTDSGGTGSGGGSMGGGTGSGSGLGAASAGGFGVASGTDSGVCPTCGQTKGGGLEQFLSRLGINEDMVNNLKGQFQNVDIDEYLSTARTYLKDGSDKATTFAKENPGKIAAGVAALALGAGLIYAATKEK
jgi:hypothetical protein